ncbi:scabin-related ADP-ribosyltransferase, partial [Streptomyces sp. NPDC002920]
LRNLDTLTGLERTGTGLLKPLDELSDLAELSLDGRLGGLTGFQVRQILDGEIDLVNVAPDGVVLRVGTTDPVDVRVRLKDGVKVDVLGPADPRVPTLTTTTGTDRLDQLGIRPDDLTRLIPDTGDDARTARDLLGLGPVRTDLTAPPLAMSPGFTPLTLRDIVTGGATGKLATERFQTWVRTQATQFQLDTAGRRLSEIDGLTDAPPLGRARAELDLSAAKIDFSRARIAFDRLGMNLDTVRRDVTVMMTRIDGPAATLPTGELGLLDSLGRPTGQWITMEPGPTANWVLKGDSGVVPDVRVTMTDGVFTLTRADGLVTRIGPDGRPLLDDIPVRPASPAGPSTVPEVHWLVRQDADFSATVGKSGLKTRLTEDGLVPVRTDGTITPLQAVSTANAKVFKENSQFTAFSAPGGTGKPFGNSEIGLDLASLSNDITAGAENVRSVRILSNTQLQQEILKEIRFAVGDSALEIPSKFTHLTKNDDIKKFLAEYNVPKKLSASVAADIKTLLQVRRDNTWLVQGAIPKEYLTGPYPTVDSLKFVPAAPATTTTIQAPTDLLESAGRASGSGLPPMETPQLVMRTDEFLMSNVDLEQLRGVKLIRQDDFHAWEADAKGLRKSHFKPDIGMVPANPDGRTGAFQHVAGAEIAERKTNSPFTSFAVSGGEKVYGDTEFALDVHKLGLDIKAGKLENVGILPARDLQQLIGDQIERTIGKRLDFSGLTGTSSRNDVIEFLRKNDVNIVGRGGKDAIGKIAGDVRVLLNSTRDQEWLIKGTIPRSYLEGPYPRATGAEAAGGPVPVGDALQGLDEAAGDLRLSDTFKTDFEVKTGSVEWRTPDGMNSGRPGPVPDRLAFAADRSVDLRTITPAPVWRTTDETLWRIGGRRPLDQIFSEGFTVRDPLETNLDIMVRTGQPSAFVSTTTDKTLVWDGVFKFEIEASGGIDVGRTFERSMGPDAWRTSGWASENEIAFPGGIAPEFIRGAYRMDAQHNLLEWIPNPDFRGSNPLPELAADLRVAGEGTSGPSALDFRGLSLDDQLRLLDQLDLGETRAFDDLGSPNGVNALDEVGSRLDDPGYLSDDFTFDRFDAPAPRTETVLVDPQEFAGTTGFRTEWQRTPLEDGGFTHIGEAGDIRMVFTAEDVLQFRDLRLPAGDGFLRFDGDAVPGSLPRVVGEDGLPLPGGAVIEPVRGALGVVTGVRVRSLDGAWTGRFDLDGTRLSEQLTLSGPVGGPLTGARLTTTFTQLPGGAQSATYRLTVPGSADGAFAVVRLDGDPARRLPGGFAVTGTATGARFVFDRGGRFVDLPVDGAPPVRLDVSGAAVPDTTQGPPSTLDGLGDLGEPGSLNRLSLPDPSRTDLTPQPAGLDARFTAHVTDGAPTPVHPSRFDGMPLSGADELTDLRLRVTEFPATDLAPASFRIDVVDFGAPGGPVRLENVTVTLREGGGVSIAGPRGGVRWQFDALGHLEYRELPLTGTDLALRFTDDALDPMPRVVGPDGVPVQGATLTPVRDATGTLSELTVRVPVPDTGGLTAVWRFEPGGALRQQELPLTLPGIDGPAGLGVKVTITPGPGGTTTRLIELTGPSNLTGSFRLGPIDATLAGRLPNGFTVTDTVTGARFHYDADGRLALRDLPARDGSGFLRFTEDATPGTPPVRLDDLGDFAGDLGDVARIFDRTLEEAGGVRGPLGDLDRLDRVTGADAPRTDALPRPDGPGPEERALVDDLWNDLVQDVRPLSADELNRVMGPDSPRTDTLSELGDLPDVDPEALQTRLDNLRRMDGELQGVDEAIRVPLSGVDELADLDLRVTRLPATDTAPQGSYRLELTDRTHGGTGPVRGSDFKVELLDGSGRFAVIDPAGTTRFAFGPDGRFLGRETVLTADGLPEGLRLKVTIDPAADGTGRVAVDVLVPTGTAGSVRLTAVNSELSGRLPSGFTLTDTITGSRFHFDHTGRLAFRDLPAEDGSGFLRFTEGAGPDTPPVRLDGLGDLGDLGGLGDFGGELNDVDLARMFDRTLDEASSLRTVPEGAPADLSGIAGAMDFLHAAPDAYPFQGLDLPGVQRLADDATASLEGLGLRPGLLGDQLREMTAQARLALRRQAVTALGDYLDLPLATRLDDLRAMPPAGRVLGDFTVTPTPHGGPGGSRYTVHHTPSDLTLGFDANRGPAYQEVFLRGGPADLDGLKLGVTGRSADGGPWTPTAVDFVAARPADDLYTVAPGTGPHGGLTLSDAAGTTHWHYGPEGVHVLRDVQLPGDRGMFRFDADAPGGTPRLLDPTGRELPGFRTEVLDDGRIALVPTGRGAQPLERTVFDPAGTLREETVAVRVKGGKVNGQYWKIDHATGKAVRLDSSGNPLTGRFDTATAEKSATGQTKLTGEGKVTLFEREILGNGNVLHLDLDRFGRARWTEFDKAGNRLRAGERIFDSDRRTFHDTLPYRWAPVDVLDVRTYTKALDGGLIRAETNAKGDWVWTRFAKDGTEALHGTREWSWTRIGYKDTYLDPATGQHAVAQRRGDIWPLDGYHGSRQYLEHPLLSGHAPGGTRANPLVHTAVGPNNKPIDFVDELTEELAQLADGGTLHVARISDQRLPAAAWYPRAGHGRFDGFFRNLVTGDSMFQVSKWTETAADGTKLRGVRLASHGGHSWQDIDRFGRIVRETRTLENGNVIEVGRSVTDPKQWAPAPKWDGTAASYELPWLDTKTGTSGTRRVAADGSFEDVFTGPRGNELLAMRSQGTGVREYLTENPARGIGADDVSGVWVDKNTQLQITGRRDHWGDLYVESHGNPREDRWTWTATGPDGQVTEGIRVQNRGSLYSRTWDDSFTDFERLENGRRGAAVRERAATGDGTVWVDATRQPGDTWSWQRISADGTVDSKGVRTYQDLAKGRWTDHIGTDVVRYRDGGRVREYAYTVNRPALAPPVDTGRITLSDLLARSARHFETDASATVNREVWQEFDMGKVVHRRDPVQGVEGRFRESESLWNQWREYQDGRLVAQRTLTGRVWATDAFGRWSAFDSAKLPEFSSLPKVGGEVGLDGHRSWRLIGREVDFRGYTTELRGYNREFRDVFHDIWTGVEDGSSASMPMWRHQLRKAVTDFTMGYLIEFGTSFAVSAITADLGNTKFDPITALQRAALNGAIGGGIRVGVNIAYDTTRLGYLKYGLTNLDQGQDWNRHPLASKDDWDGEWTVYENPTRWRSGSYDYFNGLGVGVLTGFVNNAVNAAVFGVNGQKRTGLEALEAGAWGAAGSAFTGITSGLLRYTWHATAGSRIFHRGGPGELIWQAAEALGAGTLNYGINNKGADIQPSRAFPPSGSTPTTPAPAPTPPQPLTIDPAALPDGTELL